MNAGQPYQSPRQRVWAAIRKNQECFSIKQVAGIGNMKTSHLMRLFLGIN